MSESAPVLKELIDSVNISGRPTMYSTWVPSAEHVGIKKIQKVPANLEFSGREKPVRKAYDMPNEVSIRV